MVDDEVLAATLRIAARALNDAVCLCSGPAVLPYIQWIRDGLPMTARLIVHLDPSCEDLHQDVQPHLDSDIRVASHYQNIRDFCEDISSHKIDLLVVEADTNILGCLDDLVGLLTDSALVVVLANSEEQLKLRERYDTDFFFAPVGAEQGALMMARKGVQHRLARRRRRRI